MATKTRVGIEAGERWTFAIALDWPGWCRRGKGGAEAAVEALQEYEVRYRRLVGKAFAPGPVTVVGAVPSDMHADFGAPGIVAPWDEKSLTSKEADRLVAAMEACWTGFDQGVAKAPSSLAKGPRGGGRDRDKIVDHVREAERAYASRAGVKIPPRTPWPEQREQIVAALRSGVDDAKWPRRYAINRIAWHVTDHLWEIEDRS